MCTLFHDETTEDHLMSIQDIAKLSKLLGQFLARFHGCFARAEGRALLLVYVRGLLSSVQRKNAEAMHSTDSLGTKQNDSGSRSRHGPSVILVSPTMGMIRSFFRRWFLCLYGRYSQTPSLRFSMSQGRIRNTSLGRIPHDTCRSIIAFRIGDKNLAVARTSSRSTGLTGSDSPAVV